MEVEVRDVRELLQECLQFYFPSFRPFFILDLPQHPVPVTAGWEWSCIFLNLFKNALEAGADKISVSLRRAESPEWTLRIQDNGVVCAHGNMGRLFHRSYATKKPGVNMGLGLAAVKMALQRCGGKISIMRGEGGAGLCLEVEFSAPMPSG